MHVLLLKEPRDEESGVDPYIKVNSFICLFNYNSALLVFLCFFLMGNYDIPGAGVTRTHSNPHSSIIFYVCLIKHLVGKGKVEFTV